MSIWIEKKPSEAAMTPEGRFRCPEDKKVYATKKEFQEHFRTNHETSEK
jgi:1,2-phenylacetyl-CoA epoxidase PaaB subunit